MTAVESPFAFGWFVGCLGSLDVSAPPFEVVSGSSMVGAYRTEAFLMRDGFRARQLVGVL